MSNSFCLGDEVSVDIECTGRVAEILESGSLRVARPNGTLLRVDPRSPYAKVTRVYKDPLFERGWTVADMHGPAEWFVTVSPLNFGVVFVDALGNRYIRSDLPSQLRVVRGR